MSVPFVNFRPQYDLIKEDIRRNMDEVFEQGCFILGPPVKAFEEEFATFCGTTYGVGLNSGTDALFMAMKAFDIKEGDEVILPTHTFIATALGVSYVGATPVLCDIEDQTYNLDPDKIEALITPKTKAIIVVHLYGQAARIKEIKAIADKHGLKLIEDTAQAHGATCDGQRVGSFGDIGCFSFYPTKGLGTFGDGGMLITSDKTIYERVHKLRDYGREGRYEHVMIGYNSRLDTIQAVILSEKLKYLDQWNKARRELGAYYNEQLANLDIIAPTTLSGNEHVFQTYAVRIKNRETVMKHLQAKGIGVLIHYPIPVHLQPAYAHLGHKRGDFPIAEQVADEITSLPMFPHMTYDQIDEVVNALKESL